jgi:hypothetical protein
MTTEACEEACKVTDSSNTTTTLDTSTMSSGRSTVSPSRSMPENGPFYGTLLDLDTIANNTFTLGQALLISTNYKN